ncbi:MAG: methyl-accepting chemotaxis protein [Oscillospiraceae bacterium]|nr:methyl-accepting chemotaxis protein [Oscillospiraceae bacterium]
MKNLKIANKLLVSFTIVIILTILIGVVGFIGMSSINDASTEMYELQLRPLPMLAYSIEHVQYMRIYSKELEVLIMQDNHHLIPDTISLLNSARGSVTHYLTSYLQSAVPGSEVHITLTDVLRVLNNTYFPALDRVVSHALAGDLDNLILETDSAEATIEGVNAGLNSVLEAMVRLSSQTSADNAALFTSMLTIIIIAIVVAIIASVLLGIAVSHSISKPLREYDEWMKLTANGDIVWKPEELIILENYKGRKDEIGTLFVSYVQLLDYLNEVCENLQRIAGGDLNFEINPHCENDLLVDNLQRMIEDLNTMFNEIQNASTLVHGSSRQIADGAQSLAQGSTEQAATVQELSASISEIARKTKENATMAANAATLAGSIKQSAEKGSSQMDEMMVAVKDINEASQSISKVIKVIDDIAFQTNILALNAAVEAARAGQHGKGFAVVAEEVRNLAAKSAEAAKDTGGLIASSMEKAELGAKIAENTASSLVEIVSGINDSTRLVGDIALSSEEQSRGISEVNSGIDQVAQVVQQNSATAQQSAASAQELSGQSDVLESVIGRFSLKRLDKNNFGQKALSSPKPSHASAGLPSGNGGIKKY